MIISTQQDAVVFPPFTLTIKFETQDEVQAFIETLDATPNTVANDINKTLTDNITLV